jgi:DNA-binding transcriptional regulator YdaS (Cro superfamily)
MTGMPDMPLQQKDALTRAIDQAGGKAALARKLNERGHGKVTGPAVYQWERQGRVPAEYCPDIEVVTGIACELLRPDVNWAALRKAPV